MDTGNVIRNECVYVIVSNIHYFGENKLVTEIFVILKVIPNLEDNIHEVPSDSELQSPKEVPKRYQSNDSSENLTESSIFPNENMGPSNENVRSNQSSNGNLLKKVIASTLSNICSLLDPLFFNEEG